MAHYVAVTGDSAVLDEAVPFLDGPILRDGEHEAFFQPDGLGPTRDAVRALRAGARPEPCRRQPRPAADRHRRLERRHEPGRQQGKGESIWLGWFLHATLTAFAPWPTAAAKPRAASWRRCMPTSAEALERDGWDGDWYRRGYFDDGTPLGSSKNDECRIDSIAQSWSVISGARRSRPCRPRNGGGRPTAGPSRRRLVLLFTPPFDKTPHDPGYIKGYPPGIRENGGQYTHGAIWSVIAFAMLGDGDMAGELFR